MNVGRTKLMNLQNQNIIATVKILFYVATKPKKEKEKETKIRIDFMLY